MATNIKKTGESTLKKEHYEYLRRNAEQKNPEKADQVLETLQDDVDKWLAAGNKITVLKPFGCDGPGFNGRAGYTSIDFF